MELDLRLELKSKGFGDCREFSRQPPGPKSRGITGLPADHARPLLAKWLIVMQSFN